MPYLNRYLTKSGVNKGEAGKNIHGYYPLSSPTNSPPRYPSTKEKGYLSSLLMRITMISCYTLMTITSMTARQVWRIQPCAIRLVSRMYHHLHTFRRYLFQLHFHL